MEFGNYEKADAQTKALVLMAKYGELEETTVRIHTSDGGVVKKKIWKLKEEEGPKRKARAMRDMPVEELLELRSISRANLEREVALGRYTEESLERRKRIEGKLRDIEKILAWKQGTNVEGHKE